MADAGFGAPSRDLPDGKRVYPLHFLAQIDLEALSQSLGGHDAAKELPSSGFLYFFYEAEHGGWGYDPKIEKGFRTFYVDNVAREQLTPAKPPANLATDGRYPSCTLSFRPTFVLPAEGDDRFEEMKLPDDPAMSERYDALRSKLLASSDDDPRHLLLGHPDLVQNDMHLEVQLASNGMYVGDSSGYSDARAKALAAGAKDWVLLLQIDSDDDCPGWMWGDAGRLYFWIRKQDLSAKRFDKAWMVLQCY